MRRRLAPLATIATIALLAAPALARPDPKAQLDRLLAGRTAGKPVDCITQRPTNGSYTIGNDIVYEVGSTRYLARFANGCSGLSPFRYFVTRTPSTQLCRGDIIEIREQTTSFPVGSCAFDGFVPYPRVKK